MTLCESTYSYGLRENVNKNFRHDFLVNLTKVDIFDQKTCVYRKRNMVSAPFLFSL